MTDAAFTAPQSLYPSINENHTTLERSEPTSRTKRPPATSIVSVPVLATSGGVPIRELLF